MLTEKQKEVLFLLADRLEQNNIFYYLTGGSAAIFYGSKRTTYDIDIDVHEKDMLKVRELFKKNITEDTRHYEDENFDLQLLTLEIDGVPIDICQIEGAILMDGKGERMTVSNNVPDSIVFEDRILPIQKKAELIAYKKLIARDTDIEDVKYMNSSTEISLKA